MRGYTLPKGKVQISFSGGRTSAYMLHQILAVNGDFDPERVQVVFSNTGREMPQTLDFVQECSDRWGVPVTWVELDLNQEYGSRFKVVNHNSASRNGEPFEAMIRAKKYLPNQKARFCTAELKLRPARDYLRSIGWDHWNAALGIRSDEPARLNRKTQKERWQRWYPLGEGDVTKRTVSDFWARQSFDLRLPNVKGNAALGNCDGCFLKNEKFLAGLARDYPDRHQWWERMEEITADLWSEMSHAQRLRVMVRSIGLKNWFALKKSVRRKLFASPKNPTFRTEFSRKELREFVESQGDWVFDLEDALCQADHGECTS